MQIAVVSTNHPRPAPARSRDQHQGPQATTQALRPPAGPPHP